MNSVVQATANSSNVVALATRSENAKGDVALPGSGIRGQRGFEVLQSFPVAAPPVERSDDGEIGQDGDGLATDCFTLGAPCGEADQCAGPCRPCRCLRGSEVDYMIISGGSGGDIDRDARRGEEPKRNRPPGRSREGGEAIRPGDGIAGAEGIGGVHAAYFRAASVSKIGKE
jgi:hypothetical protein